MNNFGKILHRIRLNAARYGPKLVSEALDMLMHVHYASEVRKVSHPVWENILKIIEPLRSSAVGTELSAQYLDKLFLLLEEKYRGEQHTASMVPPGPLRKEVLDVLEGKRSDIVRNPDTGSIAVVWDGIDDEQLQHILKQCHPGQRKRVALFSNYKKAGFRHLLRRLIRHAPASDAEKLIFKKRLHSHGIFAALKDLHRLAASAYEQDRKKAHLKRMELYNALYAAMSKNLSKPGSEPNFCGFRHCDVCPRLVRPPASKICRCEEHVRHGGNTTKYNKALKIGRRNPTNHNSPLEDLQEKLLAELRHVLPEKYPEGISSNEWWRQLDADPERLAACDASVQYDLVPVWEVLPRTKNLIESKGGNPLDPASVLSVLNPPETSEPPDWKERRAWLNTILTHNFAPFRLELARTEAWLRIHAEMFGGKKHGGARPGSGGARPGAGRPRKQPAENMASDRDD